MIRLFCCILVLAVATGAWAQDLKDQKKRDARAAEAISQSNMKNPPTMTAADDMGKKIMSDEVRAFFESYLAGWDMADVGKLADHYTMPTGIYGVGGPEVFTSRDLLIEKLKLYCAHFSSIGYTGADFSCRQYTPIGETSAFVDLHWTIHRKGATAYIFGTAYVLQKKSSEWRIFSAIPYELREQSTQPKH